MRVARFALKNSPGPERLAIVLGTPASAGETLLDVAAAARARGGGPPPADSMLALISGGAPALERLRELQHWAASRPDPAWLHAGAAVDWLPPVPPRSMISAGRNFGRHKLESIRGNPASGARLHSDFPTGFVKLGRTIVPHGARVKKPEDVKQMDYEVEVAVVLGQPLLNADRRAAQEAIFGYTVFNDLSARDWQLAEMHNNLLMLGKNFPGFGPLGPCILTADEVPDSRKLVLWLKVNGETRQHSDCQDLIHGFDELVAFWSKVGLEAGDVITTGTPEGVALHRKPDPTPFFLKPGDVVEAGVDGIGTLTTYIV